MNKIHVFIYAVFSLLLITCGEKHTTIPFNYERNIYLQAKINDTITGNIMFDTGAYGLYLDSTFNSRAGMNCSFFNHDLAIAGVSCPLALQVNEFRYSPSFLQIVQTKPSFGKQCDGIIGWDLFPDRVLRIDYIQNTLKVYEPGELDLDDFQKVPLLLKNNLFYVDLQVAINDSVSIAGKYVLDLGFGGSIYFTGETARKYSIPLVAGKKMEFGVDWGLFEKRRSTGIVFRGKNIRIGNFELSEPTVESSFDITGVLAAGEYVGLLGNRALEHFDVVIDLHNHNLYLKPNKNYSKRMKFRTTGLGFVDRTDICEGFFVSGIFLTSAADSAGIRSGDLITHVDGKAVKENSAQKVKDFYKEDSKDRTVTFKRGDSVFVLKLALRDYL